MKDLATLMMESFVVIVDQHREDQGLGKKEFAMKCWPESPPAAAAIRWQIMRTKSRNTNRPQGILLSDVQRMADVLNIEPAYLMLESMALTRSIMSKEQENKSVTKKNKSRRKPVQ